MGVDKRRASAATDSLKIEALKGQSLANALAMRRRGHDEPAARKQKLRRGPDKARSMRRSECDRHSGP